MKRQMDNRLSTPNQPRRSHQGNKWKGQGQAILLGLTEKISLELGFKRRKNLKEFCTHDCFVESLVPILYFGVCVCIFCTRAQKDASKQYLQPQCYKHIAHQSRHYNEGDTFGSHVDQLNAERSQDGATGSGWRVELQHSCCVNYLCNKLLRSNFTPKSQLVNKRNPAGQMLNVPSRVYAFDEKPVGEMLQPRRRTSTQVKPSDLNGQARSRLIDMKNPYCWPSKPLWRIFPTFSGHNIRNYVDILKLPKSTLIPEIGGN